MGERGITPSEPYTEYCEFCNEGAGSGSSGRAGDDTAVVVEVAVATDAHGEDDGPLCFYRSAALPLAASIKVYGPYENIAPVYASFARWLEDHPAWPALRARWPTAAHGMRTTRRTTSRSFWFPSGRPLDPPTVSAPMLLTRCRRRGGHRERSDPCKRLPCIPSAS